MLEDEEEDRIVAVASTAVAPVVVVHTSASGKQPTICVSDYSTVNHMKYHEQQQQQQPKQQMSSFRCNDDSSTVDLGSSLNRIQGSTLISGRAGIGEKEHTVATNYVITAFQQQQQSGNPLLHHSSSSLNMYHHQLPSTSTSTSSSYTSRMMLLDHPHHEEQPFCISPTRDSMLMKQALKAQQRKRRESIGEVVTTRKRPTSVPVTPRLTKSSILQTSNNSPKRLRDRRKHLSLQPLSSVEKERLATLESKEEKDILSAAGVHWDPHIDAFEILRAKVTGITRSMQEFHVQELFHDEIMGQQQQQQRKRISFNFPRTTSTSSPLITTATEGNKTRGYRRLSLATQSHSLSLDPRRIRSQSFTPSYCDPPDDDFYSSLPAGELKSSSDDEEDDEDIAAATARSLTSSNLSSIFFTTNNLINSRLDELSETASIKSNTTDHLADTTSLEWQKQFLSLVTSCIQQSEALESLSTDVLNTEHRVRELMLVHDTIHEQFHQREKQYEERIRECQEVAQQQLMMLDSLEELTADVDMKTESHQREMHRKEALMALGRRQHQKEEQDQSQNEEEEEEETSGRWSFQKSVADLLNMEDKYEIIQKMRWDVGMFVGGGVGTGHVIHSFEDRLNGIDIMIAGTGTTTTLYDSDPDEEQQEEIYPPVAKTFSVSPTIQRRIQLHQHQYILHLNSKDRLTRFALLPKTLWVPDHETSQCQFQYKHQQCQTLFSFFRRKHHCRRCGSIVCQRHSANRLPLFNRSTQGKWSRVCDTCFHNLVMQK